MKPAWFWPVMGEAEGLVAPAHHLFDV